MKSKEMFIGFRVAAGDDRLGEQIKLGGEPHDCKVSSQDTDGAMCVFEFTGHGGGPRHLHYDRDEWIYVIDGEFEFEVGEKRMRLGAGECVFIPRRVAHVWASLSDKAGKIINIYQPAGRMGEFFREIPKLKSLPSQSDVIHNAYTEEQIKALHKLFDAHGMDVLGPPLIVK